MKIGFLLSHPIQYYSPWFRELAQSCDLTVYYGHRPSQVEQAVGFGGAFEWDVDLLSGYDSVFLENVSSKPDVDHYAGVDTPQIEHEIQVQKYDVFVVGGWFLKCYWQAARACRRLNVPVLVRGDSQINPLDKPYKALLKRITYPWMLKRFDGFLSVGARFERYLRSYGVPADKIFHCPHFIDNRFFIPAENPVAPQRAPVVLFVGKFIPKKRPMDLLQALSLLYQQGRDDIHAQYVGSGELVTELQSYAQQNQLDVTFCGFKNQSELLPYYQQADVLVLPSDYAETWGLVVNEAMACGLPCVVSEAAGCSEDMIDEGQTGYRYPLGDITALADAILASLSMKQHLHCQQALQAKVTDYSIEQATRRLCHAAQQLGRN